MKLIYVFISALIYVSIIFDSANANGQGYESSGWFFLSHSQKLSKKLDLLADFQLRTADKGNYINTLLLRTAFQYHVTDVQAFAVGYASKSDWTREDDHVNYDHENRIYQQYQLNANIKKTELNVRMRLEQRFIKEESEERTKFSQRARLFISSKIPLLTDKDFTHGLYTNVQNEIFFNVQHKSKINNSFFDQNRAQIAFGFRWSKKIDTDLGYQFWYQKELDGVTKTNILVLNISTEF
jgi:hypothetical protein